MGLEATYQALPAASPLLSHLKAEVALGDFAFYVFGWIREGANPSLAPGPPDPEELRVWALVGELLQEYPRLSDQHCYLDRQWDSLHYLLSASRRDEAPTADDALAEAAIRGERTIAEHVRAGQGAPIRYSEPETVRRISRWLDSLSFDGLRRHLVPEQMVAARVYKSSARDGEAEEWNRLRAHFEHLRALYRAASVHGDGVLVKLD